MTNASSTYLSIALGAVVGGLPTTSRKTSQQILSSEGKIDAIVEANKPS